MLEGGTVRLPIDLQVIHREQFIYKDTKSVGSNTYVAP